MDLEDPKRKKPDESSGIVTLEGDKAIWHNEDLVFATVDLRDAVIIGEYTTASGPWIEDWFLVLVTKDGQWHQVSCYAQGIETLTEYLSRKFNIQLHLGALVNSTSWKTVVVYPLHLNGKQLFELVPAENYNPPKNVIQKFLHYGLGLGKFNTTQEVVLSADVMKELQAIK
jgi:hypothetical protein